MKETPRSTKNISARRACQEDEAPAEAETVGFLPPTLATTAHGSQHMAIPTKIALFHSMSDAAMKGAYRDDGEVAIRIGEREVHRSPSSLLNAQESNVIRFRVVDLAPIYSVDLQASENCFNASVRRVGIAVSRTRIHLPFRRLAELPDRKKGQM